MTSTLDARAYAMLSCAASTRSTSTAINRPARFASCPVSVPGPGPISRTVLWEISPRASTIFVTAAWSRRKCCPSLGLPFGALPLPLVTLTPFLADAYTCVGLARFQASPRAIIAFHGARLRTVSGGSWFMHIAFAASEGVPYSKTGGLADVVGALPRALAALGHQVSVYLPRYRQTKLADPATVVRSITVPFDDEYRFPSVVSGGMQSGVRFYFVEYPPYFDRDALYGTPAGDYPDNAERFALFSRAVLEASKIIGVPQIFHCHDWQSALVPVLLRTSYVDDP